MLIGFLLVCATVLAKHNEKGSSANCNTPNCRDCTNPKAENEACTDCDPAYVLNGGQCVEKACNTPNCKACDNPKTDNEVCTACDPAYVLNGGQCVEKACNTPNCKACDNPKTDNEVCTACDPAYVLNGGQCVEKACNTPNCKACDNPKTDNEVCTKCNDGDYLTPTNQCVPDCTAISGYYGDSDKKCKACNPECAECVGPANNQCTACPVGKMLQYTDTNTPVNGGTCMDQCSVSSTNDGCAECGAQIGGTAYCSKCKNTQQAPLNGNCAASSRVAFCATITSGACTKCNEGYFLKDGGCYQTDRQPGKQVCSSAQGGTCQTCANGLQAQGGACGECHSTCATCSTAGDPNKCKTCATGYYKENGDDTTAGLCKKCSEKISGCKQCVSSSGSSVICLESEVGTGGSVNKSGLSTGAIAGISVAVVVVVGGLVGFLCWWFVCRGKA
ncbi:VSP with INR [Giardia duodenalis]|uniref:VSP with INR n=3 Tax=Giardia intestinalis TaxID=5741 RepID=E2RTX4_GIAIC|nr:VSP with INR [Giardia intestinalis]AAN52097.1 variant-specific surface protein S2 [Giardia intestinalis]KAE8304771.1 VSP with INR [Giardia intestinalis]|eukprot:XP_001704186.1 VSP with INR [Giardia lamblia ATCC 50803]